DRSQPWDELVRSASEVQDLAAARTATPPMQVEGSLSRPAVTALVATAGREFQYPIDPADQPNLQPICLPAKVSSENPSQTTAVTALVATAGHEFQDLIDLADQPNFKPISLPVKFSLEIQSETTAVTARNLVATLDPQNDEDADAKPYVLISSHWNDLPEAGA